MCGCCYFRINDECIEVEFDGFQFLATCRILFHNIHKFGASEHTVHDIFTGNQ